MRRVVITGLGLLTPLGYGVSINWNRLIQGESGLRTINRFDVSNLPCKVAGLIPLEKEGYLKEQGAFNADDFVSPKDQRKMDDFMIYAIAAAEEAIKNSGWVPTSEEDHERTGVLIGSGIGGLTAITEGACVFKEQGPKKLTPFYIPSCLINLASGHVSIRHGYKGPNHAVVTACSTGAHAIGDAARLIQFDDADVMIAGGSEAAICPVGIGGFCSARALSTAYNDTPSKASRPWDTGRDGFVMGEGAGIVVLEEYEHAKKRGATIYGEIVGYGLSGDAHHITAPAPDGNGGLRAMKSSLKRSGLSLEQIGYINAHGTSTPVGDIIELRAIQKVFEGTLNTLSMSSTKSSIGHLLGGAGSVEAIYSLLAMKHGILPPTLNLDNPEEDCQGINLVPHVAQEKKIDAVLSNSFGFGGTNASLVFKKV
jgi:3-oxoacyl-[acyl-carrier-protein] synthase II